MAREYAEIKKNAEELATNIELLSKEALSFKEAKTSLSETAETIRKAAEHLVSVTDNSEKMLEEVQSVSTDKTLKELRSSAEAIISACDSIQSANEKATTAMLKSNQECLEKIVDSNEEAINSIDLKVKIMGAIAIACSLGAVILAVAM